MLISTSVVGDMLDCRQSASERTRLKLLELYDLKHVESQHTSRGLSFLYRQEDVDAAVKLKAAKEALEPFKVAPTSKGNMPSPDCLKAIADIKDAVETNAGNIHDIDRKVDLLTAKLNEVLDLLRPYKA